MIGITSSKIVLMLILMAIDLFIKACFTDTVASLQPVIVQTSSPAQMILLVFMLVLNYDNLIKAIGAG